MRKREHESEQCGGYIALDGLGTVEEELQRLSVVAAAHIAQQHLTLFGLVQRKDALQMYK